MVTVSLRPYHKGLTLEAPRSPKPPPSPPQGKSVWIVRGGSCARRKAFRSCA